MCNVHHIPLPAVAIQPFPGAGIIDDVLRQALADDEADERLGGIVDGFMSGSAGRKT